MAELGKGLAAALVDESQIPFPRVVAVFQRQRPELERHGLRHAVIDIVQRIQVDVKLPLPARASGIERQVFKVNPRPVLLLELQPRLVALFRRHVLVLVHQMLELVDHAAVGDEDERVLTVADLVLSGLVAEEVLMIVLRQKLHRHRVALARLNGGRLQLHREVLPERAVVGESVARLVRQNVHVARGAVEVREDERHLVRRDAGAVAAGRLAGLGQNVKELAVKHGVYELGRFRAQLVVHPLAGRQDFIGRALGLGVAVGKEHQIVVVVHLLHAKALLLVALDGGHDGHHVVRDLLAEGLDLRLAIAVAAQTVVAQLDVVLMAQRTRLRVAALDELGVQFVELLPMLVKESALGLKRLAAGGAVGALFIRPQLRQRQLFAAEVGHRAGIELLIAGGQLVFLLHQLHDFGLKGAHGNLGVRKQQLAVAGLQLRAELRAQQRQTHALYLLLQQRANLVAVLVFLVIELVAGIDGVAHIGQRHVRLHVAGQRLIFLKRVNLRPGIFSLGHAAHDVVHFPAKRVDIGSGIRHFREFHTDVAFFPALWRIFISV